MNSKSRLIDLAYKREEFLRIDNPDYTRQLKCFTFGLLKEDLGKKGDITTEAVLRSRNIKEASIVAKEKGVLAGIEELGWFYAQNNLKTTSIRKDGDIVEPGDVVIKLNGSLQALLKTERVGLNLLQRMSGIATLTHKLAQQSKPVLVAATRKTPWGNLDNKAVSVGGGATHRLGLWESILIKENHLEALVQEGVEDTIAEAIRRAWQHRKEAVFIEIEVETIRAALQAAEQFVALKRPSKVKKPCIIMLDNFSPKKVHQTVRLLKQRNYYKRLILEASGGVTPANIPEYRDAGVDVVSLGYLTHSPTALDLSQLIKK